MGSNQSSFKIRVATKDHIRLRPFDGFDKLTTQAQGFGGQEEHREKPFYELYVIFCGEKSG